MIKRMIHKKLYENEEFACSDIYTRQLYIYLIVTADDEGKLKLSEKTIKRLCFPYDDITEKDIKTRIFELYDLNFIRIHEVENQLYISHPKWELYQKIRKDMKKDSILPVLDENNLYKKNKTCTGEKKPVQENKKSTLNINKDNINKVNIIKGQEKNKSEKVSPFFVPFRNKYFEVFEKHKHNKPVFNGKMATALKQIIKYLENNDKCNLETFELLLNNSYTHKQEFFKNADLSIINSKKDILLSINNKSSPESDYSGFKKVFGG